MLERHYSSRDIINAGETLVDGLLSELIYTATNWHALFGLLLTKNRQNLTGRGEVDFILVCEYGVLVVEVKGGLITYKDAKLLQREINGHKEKVIDPFGQVRGNCDTIKTLLHTRLHSNIFVGEAVVFPQSDFQYKGESFQHFWHMKSPASLGVFLEQTLKRQALNFGFEKLKSKEILQIIHVLTPEVNWEKGSERLQHAKQETERRGELNYNILKGLGGNDRILIEGPPGSGKSTFAQKFIIDKVEKEDLRVLYLCWNELLAVHTRQLFTEKGMEDKVMDIAFFDYINSLFSRHPTEPKQLNFTDVPYLYDHTTDIVTELQSVLWLDTYDLIVVDEAQDLFDKGIDVILDKQLNEGKNGLSKGSYIVFYDALQAFDKGTDTALYQLIHHTIKESSAYYRLFTYFRTIEGSGIANFLDDAMSGSIDFSRIYGSDMVVKTYSSLEDCLALIKATVKTITHVDKVKPDDMVVLFSSNLISGSADAVNKKPLDVMLFSDETFEKIGNENLATASKKIRYTTAIKYKGLESDVVLLVIKDLFDEKIKTFYQMYIGASRAKAKLVLLIDENSKKLSKKQELNYGSDLKVAQLA